MEEDKKADVHDAVDQAVEISRQRDASNVLMLPGNWSFATQLLRDDGVALGSNHRLHQCAN